MTNYEARIPWTLIIALILLWVPWVGSRYDTFIATQILIYSLFALSLNLLVGMTGLYSFGHVAYFGIGAYTCAILMKKLGVSFVFAFPLAGVVAGLFAAFFGYFCVRLTKIYFAMLTLAFSQIVWAVCIKWTDLTGGDQGISDIPFPALDWMNLLPGFDRFRISDRFFFVTLLIVAICVGVLRRISESPFGRVLTTIRENRERAAFIGVNVRAYELSAFIVAGFFAGLAGALFGIFNRGVFTDYVHWAKSADVLIMTLLGGMHSFWGPAVGAAVLTILNQQITAHTQYWPFFLGVVLVALLFIFPGGILGALSDLRQSLNARLKSRRPQSTKIRSRPVA